MSMGHNSVSGKKLMDYVQEYERLSEEIKALQEDRKAQMANAKAEGFAPKYIKFCVKVREIGTAEFQEIESLKATYLHACGLAEEPPLFKAVGLMTVDNTSRDQVISVMKTLVPEGGDIIVRVGGKAVRIWRDAKGDAQHEDYVEPEPPTPSSMAPAPAPASDVPPEEVPDVDEDGAAELGAKAQQNNQPIITNPFPHDDPRGVAWDRAWRASAGHDGINPDD